MDNQEYLLYLLKIRGDSENTWNNFSISGTFCKKENWTNIKIKVFHYLIFCSRTSF